MHIDKKGIQEIEMLNKVKTKVHPLRETFIYGPFEGNYLGRFPPIERSN